MDNPNANVTGSQCSFNVRYVCSFMMKIILQLENSDHEHKKDSLFLKLSNESVEKNIHNDKDKEYFLRCFKYWRRNFNFSFVNRYIVF